MVCAMNIQWLYLDMNIYNRAFDDQRQARVRLETLACQMIFELIQHRRFSLVWSFMLAYENRLNPYPDRRDEIDVLARLARQVIEPSAQIVQRAEKFESHGLRNHDAIHLACAEVFGCQAFITCDDHLIKKAQILDLRLMIVNPLMFLQEVQTDVDESTAVH
jgi:predicted nucleic acid-binding protein